MVIYFRVHVHYDRHAMLICGPEDPSHTREMIGIVNIHVEVAEVQTGKAFRGADVSPAGGWLHPGSSGSAGGPARQCFGEMQGSLRLYFGGHERGVFVNDRRDQCRSCHRQSCGENGAALRWIADGEAGKSERAPDGGENRSAANRRRGSSQQVLVPDFRANGAGVFK
jgi:hypothetical protein